MKTGDVISKSDLIQKGFYLSCWFAGYVVFKKFNQEEEDYTYVFLDYWTNEINNILTSKQWKREGLSEDVLSVTELMEGEINTHDTICFLKFGIVMGLN